MCCKGCENRTLACHDKCEAYRLEREEALKKKKWLKEKSNHITSRVTKYFYGDGAARNAYRNLYR